MNQVFSVNPNTQKNRDPVVILSLVSLICTALNCVTYFVYYTYDFSNGEFTLKLTVGFPNILSLLSLLLTLAPAVLLVLYILMFHRQLKATVLMPITYGVIALSSLFDLINLIINNPGPMTIIIDLAIIVSFALATYSALKGLTKKLFIIIASGVGLITNFISIIEYFKAFEYYLNEKIYLYLFTWIIGIAGTATLYVALLLFGLKNKIPAILSTSLGGVIKAKQDAGKMNPEQALRTLKDKYDLGMITEEEYQAQRAEIIEKL